MILTDAEISEIETDNFIDSPDDVLNFARSIEQAIIDKLKQNNEQIIKTTKQRK